MKFTIALMYLESRAAFSNSRSASASTKPRSLYTVLSPTKLRTLERIPDSETPAANSNCWLSMASDRRIYWRSDGVGVAQKDRSFADRKRRHEQSTFDELMMPELSGYHAHHCLALFLSDVQPGATTAHQAANGRCREYANPPQGLAGEMVTDPGGRRRQEEVLRFGRTLATLPTHFQLTRKDAGRPSSEHLLALYSAESRSGWQRRSELEQAMVEKRISPFHAVR